MKRKISKSLFAFFILINSCPLYGQIDTFKISVYLHGKQLVANGKVIKKSKVVLGSEHLKLTDGYYLLNSFQKDTIHIKVSYKHYSSIVIFDFPKLEQEIQINKSNYSTQSSWLRFNYLFNKFICPRYYISQMNPFGHACLYSIKNDRRICHKCKQIEIEE